MGPCGGQMSGVYPHHSPRSFFDVGYICASSFFELLRGDQSPAAEELPHCNKSALLA